MPARRRRRATHGSIPLPEWCTDECRETWARTDKATRKRKRETTRKRWPKHTRNPRAKPTQPGQLGMRLTQHVAATSVRDEMECPRCGKRETESAGTMRMVGNGACDIRRCTICGEHFIVRVS